MAKRIFSTVVLWAIVGGALWFFRTAGALVLITLVSVLTLREFYQMMHASGYQPFDKLGMFVGALITLAPWWVGAQFGKPVHLLLPLLPRPGRDLPGADAGPLVLQEDLLPA